MRLVMLASVIGCLAPHALLADEVCLPNKDTSLFADSALSQEDRMVFQYDGVQFVPASKENGNLYGWAFNLTMQQLLETPSFTPAADWDCQDFPEFDASGAQSDVPSSVAVYDYSAEACQQELTDTRLEITDQYFRFYESTCDISDMRAKGDATHYTLSCYGEGETWEVAAVVSTSSADGSITIKVDEYVDTYVLCGQY